MLWRIFFLIPFVYFPWIYSGQAEDLDAFIEKARKEYKVPGVAVSVVKGKEVIFTKGYGTVGAGQTEKINEDTIFQLASVTKAFTAAALGIEKDQGNFGWEKEIIRYLPSVVLYEPYSTRYVTGRDLLAHRTGLPAFGGDLLGKLDYKNDEILNRIRYIKPATSFRNKAFYSNVGYFIAGEVLKQINDSSYEDAISEKLFVPLAMQRSGFSSNLDRENVAYANAIIDGKTQVIAWDRTGGFQSAGGITSTAADMAKWMLMLLNKGNYQGQQVLKEETVQELFAPSMVAEVSFTEAPPIDANSNFSFGLGWDLYRYKGFQIVEKGGGLDGVRTVVTLVPELGIGITILSNLNLTLLPEAIRAQFLDLFVAKSDADIQSKIKNQERIIADIIKKPEKPKSVVPPDPIDNYSGVFSNELYGTFYVLANRGELSIQAGPNHLRGTLSHFSNDTFLLSWPTINSGYDKVTFTFGPDGKASSFSTEALGTFTKVKPE